MDDETNLEKVAGSLPTAVAGTLLAAFSGTPLSALLPVLTSALASTRHTQRVEAAIMDMSADLERQKNKLRDLSDVQYKIINEAVLSVFQTLDEQKLRILRNVVRNTIEDQSIEIQEAALISRLVRDLSAAEAMFLLERRDIARFMLSENRPSDSDALHIEPDSDLGLVASGLVSLGLLVTAEPTWDDTGRLRYSPIVKKLVSLLDEPDA